MSNALANHLPHTTSAFVGGLEWIESHSPIDYPCAVDFMEQRVQGIIDNTASEAIWLLQHPPLYTAGVRAVQSDLLNAGGLPVFASGRGGQYTYHGPGQRVVYTMLDLRKRGQDVKQFVTTLEQWGIATLHRLGIKGEQRHGRIGVWVVSPESDRGKTTLSALGSEQKIIAIGVKLRRWVSFHGLSINVDPNLDHFRGIVPCGLKEYSVTSLKHLGCTADMHAVDAALRTTFDSVWNKQAQK